MARLPFDYERENMLMQERQARAAQQAGILEEARRQARVAAAARQRRVEVRAARDAARPAGLHELIYGPNSGSNADFVAQFRRESLYDVNGVRK